MCMLVKTLGGGGSNNPGGAQLQLVLIWPVEILMHPLRDPKNPPGAVLRGGHGVFNELLVVADFVTENPKKIQKISLFDRFWGSKFFASITFQPASPAGRPPPLGGRVHWTKPTLA